jgi:hypothetical protein
MYSQRIRSAPFRILAFVKFPELSGRGGVADHILGVVGELAHDFQQLEFAADGDVDFDAGQEHGEAEVAALPDFVPEAPEAGKRFGMRRLTDHGDPPLISR